MLIKEINVIELKNWIKNKIEFQLIDIRNIDPDKVSYIDFQKTLFIPKRKLNINISKLKKNIPVILYCYAGIQSYLMVEVLSKNYGFDNLYSLIGGIYEWEKMKI